MKKDLLRLFMVVLMALGLSLSGYAQMDTGVVIGQVQGEDGYPIPGVEVTILGPKIMGGKFITNTDENGNYRFARVPIGEYVVEFKMKGFNALKRENIKVSHGSKFEVNAVLTLVKIEETISVTAEAPLLDSVKPSFNKSVDRKTLMILPVNRGGHVEEISKFNAGDCEPHMGATLGQGWYHNSYVVDGANVADVGGGDAWLVPNYETVEEVQYIYGGSNAEDGDFVGAIAKAITRTGSNRFFGALGFYYSHDKLTDRNTDEEWSSWNSKNDTYDLTIGGPIIRDKVWFFTSYFLNPVENEYAFTDITNEYIYRKYTGKITTKFHPNHRSTFSFFVMRNTAINWGISQYATPSTHYDMDMSSWQIALNHTSFLSKNLIFDAVAFWFPTRYHYPPKSWEPSVYNLATGMMTGGRGYHSDTKQDNLEAIGKFSLYLDDLAGSHEWKLGFEYQFGGRGSDVQLTGGMMINDYGYAKYATMYDPYYRRENVRRYSTFLQDDWTIGPRLTIGFGVRYDYIQGYIGDQEQPDGSVVEGPGVVATFKCLAPRLALNYELTKDGKTMFRVNWGRYFNVPPSAVFSTANPAYPTYRYAMWLGNDWYVYRTYKPTAGVIDPDTKNYHNDLLTISLERQIFSNASLSVTYMKRWSADYYGTVPLHDFAPVQIVDSYSGQTVTVYDYISPTSYIFSNIPDEYNLYDTYNAFQIVFNKRLSNNWYLNMSYHYERNYGTMDNGYNPFHFIGYQHYGVRVDPNWAVNREGYPYFHQPHQFKLIGAYIFPWDITVSTFVSYYSGNPWNRIHFVQTPDVYATFNAEPKGSRRTPALFNVDLNVRKTFRFSKNISLDIAAQISNLFNSGTISRYYQMTGNYQEAYFGDPYGNVAPRQAILEAKIRF